MNSEEYKIRQLESTIDNLNSELYKERMKNNYLSSEIDKLMQKISILENQLENNFQTKNNIKNNPYDKLIGLLTQKENIIYDLKEKIKRYPCILEKNENLLSIIFYSVDQKVNYSMICKNTDSISKLEGKLYEKYPNLSERENNFLFKGEIINKLQSFEKGNIKNGDIIILNQKDSSIPPK